MPRRASSRRCWRRTSKQPFNVVNRTGGSGVVGHSAIATAAPDGYTLGMITVEISMMHWQGLTELKPDSYTPLALMNEDPPGIQVNSASPHKTVKELADFIKASPHGKLKASGTGQGGIWHLALVGWLRRWASRRIRRLGAVDGAAPAMQDLAAGGIDLVTCSLPEARAMIDAGRPPELAVMSADRNVPCSRTCRRSRKARASIRPSAPGAASAHPRACRPVSDRHEAVLKKVNEAAEFRDFMGSRGFGVKSADAAGFRKLMEEGNMAMGVVMKAAGLAKGLARRL